MKQFFTVVFGGLFIVLGSIAISWGSGIAWNALSSRVNGFSIAAFAQSVRYTAVEEEDSLTNIKQSFTSSLKGPVTSRAYLLKNLTHDEVVSERDSNIRLPIASVTKLVTAIVARRLIPEGDHVDISANVVDTYGNTASFRAGEVFRAKDLYYPLLMVSSNDAAEALARSYGREQFIQAMNDFMQFIGAYRTYFADPSGLSPDNESTASDLATILEWIRNNDPEILEITRLTSKSLRSHTWVNPTHFLNWSNYMGGKNGYIPEADRTSAGLFVVGPSKDLYAVIVLGSSERDADVAKILSESVPAALAR